MTESEAVDKLKNMRLFMQITDKNSEHKFAEDDYKANEIAIQALEKQTPKKPNHKYIKYGRHKWKKDEDGKIDYWAWEYEFCNGVVCERCGKSVCVHCNPDYDKLDDCEANIYSCPFCDKKVGYRQKYCDCGQKLDWGDEE